MTASAIASGTPILRMRFTMMAMPHPTTMVAMPHPTGPAANRCFTQVATALKRIESITEAIDTSSINAEARNLRQFAQNCVDV